MLQFILCAVGGGEEAGERVINLILLRTGAGIKLITKWTFLTNTKCPVGGEKSYIYLSKTADQNHK